MFDADIVRKYCRILGVHVSASKAELKSCRNRLARLYHPDKHLGLSSHELKLLQQQFQQVQIAYDFLISNYDEIQTQFAQASDFNLTTKINKFERAHWVYNLVQNLDN